MRSVLPACITAAALAAACGGGSVAEGRAGAAAAIPEAAACRDAPEWKQRAAETLGGGLESSSDQAQVSRFSRANFYSAMAIAAELQCITAAGEAGPAVTAALEAAREASNTRGFYAQAILWGEAQQAAHRAIEVLVQQLPALDVPDAAAMSPGAAPR
jgi:hypothetical protein